MIICPKCNNSKKFREVLIGGFRRENYEQLENGRWEFVGSDASNVKSTEFECGECGYKLNHLYRKFLDGLYEVYEEAKHGV